jgi:hypothetical protein
MIPPAWLIAKLKAEAAEKVRKERERAAKQPVLHV